MKPCTRHELEQKLVCDSTEKMFFLFFFMQKYKHVFAVFFGLLTQYQCYF